MTHSPNKRTITLLLNAYHMQSSEVGYKHMQSSEVGYKYKKYERNYRYL